MSRSCHRATFSSAAWAFALITRLSPQMRSDSSGLRLCGIGLEPELTADVLFDVRIDVGEVSNGARQLADGHHLPGPAQALEVATGLDVPDGDLEAEGGRLGVDAVSAAHDQRVLVTASQVAE